MSQPPLFVMWFRRDLRLSDNRAFSEALRAAEAARGRVIPLFVFDRDILDKLHDRDDRRVKLIWQSVRGMDQALRVLNSGMLVLHAPATLAVPRLLRELAPRGLAAVYTNHDYEPRRLQRDDIVERTCSELGVEFCSCKDHVIFEKNEVLTNAGGPFTVYSPYARQWYRRLEACGKAELAALPTVERFAEQLAPRESLPASDAWDSLATLGFEDAGAMDWHGGELAAQQAWSAFKGRIADYARDRDTPGVGGVSRLSPYLRFGTLSVRQLVREGLELPGRGPGKWVDEIVWREFYNAVLHFFPQSEYRAFKPKFEAVAWDDPRTDDRAALRLEAWRQGRTGYPIVDAAMRELNTTGYMHNRCRMIVASFLTKDLHIHWKWGERYFARKLLDYDLSQNVGGWQWAASTGADGQPYFRIFSPILQGERHDPDGRYVRAYCPELADVPDRYLHRPWDHSERGLLDSGAYPEPIVDHGVEREEALRRFKMVDPLEGVSTVDR